MSLSSQTCRGRIAVVAVVLCATLLSSACGPQARDGEITILTYNVQNLFDDVDDGTEYRDYDPGAGAWNSAKYHAKLDAVARVILSSHDGGPTIVAMQEVENTRALRELVDTYLGDARYRETVLLPTPGSPVNNAVLSKLPVSSIRSHSVAFLDADRPVRDILEVWIDTKAGPVAILVNHWKSRSGGAEQTEAMRRAAASIVARRIGELSITHPDLEVLVAGDLNLSVDEYERIDGAYRTALLPADEARANGSHGTLDSTSTLCVTFDPAEASVDSSGVVLFSPWRLSTTPGSYVYRGEWETIDHFLLTPGLVDQASWTFSGFRVVRESFMMNADGGPRRWIDDSGYSDHFPLLLTLTLR